MQRSGSLDSTNLLLKTGPLADSVDCPCGMFCNQRFRIQGCWLQGWQIFACADIAERDANVSQKPTSLDPFDWRITKKIAELRLAQAQIVPQRIGGRRFSRGEGRFARDFRKPIPWARVQTIVATKNAVADQGPKLERNRAFQFDREIGDAAPRI